MRIEELQSLIERATFDGNEPGVSEQAFCELIADVPSLVYGNSAGGPHIWTRQAVGRYRRELWTASKPLSMADLENARAVVLAYEIGIESAIR